MLLEITSSVLLVIALALIIFLLFSIRQNKSFSNEIDRLKSELDSLSLLNNELKNELSVLAENNRITSETLGKTQQKNDELIDDNKLLLKMNSELKSDYRNSEKLLEEQKRYVEEINKRFEDRFKSIATDILRENSKSFSDMSQKEVALLVNPLKENLSSFKNIFENKVGDVEKGRVRLETEMKNIIKLNQQMSDSADNLTKALKGDVKAQGVWGEVVLEKLLEMSGLQNGREYTTQDSFRDSDGDIKRPDVIINLPNDKKIIIDAKLTLNSYDDFCNCNSEEEKESHIRRFLHAIRQHINVLSSKEYFNNIDVNSVDYVVMFIPIEGAYVAAVQNSKDLYGFAWNKKIIVTCPSTLFSLLKTVSYIWQNDRQNKNVEEIAASGGALYDKLVSFLESMEKVNRNIEGAAKSYEEAIKKTFYRTWEYYFTSRKNEKTRCKNQ